MVLGSPTPRKAIPRGVEQYHMSRLHDRDVCPARTKAGGKGGAGMLSQQPSTTSHEALALPVVPEEHQALILFYLQRVDKLLHAYARAAHLDYDDLHQDA